MATTFVQLDLSKRLANSLLVACGNQLAARDSFAQLKAVMDTMVNVSDYSVLEAQFGIPTGQGQTFYNLVAGVVSDLAGFNTTSLLARLAIAR